MIRGCGASNVDVRCQEFDSENFLCICPGEKITKVGINGTFEGCADAGTPALPDEILAVVNTTYLEAYLINGVKQVLGATVVTINGNSFTLNINATVAIDGLTSELQTEIAAWLGGDYTSDDITIEFTKKRDASNGQMHVTVEGQTAGASTFSFLAIGLFAVMTILL